LPRGRRSQGSDDVEHPDVDRLAEALVPDVGEVEEAERVEPMVEGDDHDPALGQSAAVGDGRAARAHPVAAAVQEHHHR